jgi:type VII secretion-associated serine protease mycosin
MRARSGSRSGSVRSVFAACAATVIALSLALTVSGAALAPVPTLRTDSVRDRQYWLDDYGITTAWKTTRGEGVTIAVIDTGVDSTHPDMRGAVVGGADFSGLGSSNGQVPVGEDGSEHGTMVASLAAARGQGSAGIIGTAPAASILAVSIGFGEGEVSSDDQIAEAVRWSVDNGADIINMSLTRNTLEWPESWDDAFLYAMDRDVVIVAAAGNRGSGTTVVGAPATMPGVLAVGGVSRDGAASRNASSQGITIAVSAPSEQLIGATPGGGHALWDGTSGATPIVAGVVALVRAAHPELSAANIINRITATARPAGVAGVDPIYGYGLLDAAAAVTADIPAVTENPMGDLAEWVRINRRADSPELPPSTEAPLPLTTPVAAPNNDNPLGTILPTIAQLRDVGVPLLVLMIFGGSVIAMLIGATQHFRSLRRKG